jgi:prepilin-type N-terminal cleavage/methylation domain-containing protein
MGTRYDTFVETTPMFTKRFAGMRNNAGFTMVEILIVLIIAAILVAMAQPSLTGFVQRNYTRRTIDRLVADVTSVRMQAVRDGRRMAVTVEGDGTYTIDTLSTSGVWAPMRTIDLENEYPGVAMTPANQRLEFNSRGLLVGASGNEIVTARRGSQADSMFVSAAGRVYRDF